MAQKNFNREITHMRDQRFGKEGFFTLSKISQWLYKMFLVFNPPLRKLERVPVRITVNRDRKNF